MEHRAGSAYHCPHSNYCHHRTGRVLNSLKEEPHEADSSIVGVAHAILARWWVILLVLLATVGSTVFFTAHQTPRYRSAATLIVVVAPEVTQIGDISRALEGLERRTIVATFARLPETGEAQRAAASALRIPVSDLASYRVEGSVVPNTNILRISTEGPDRVVTSALANVLARITASEARAMYRVYTMRTLEEARTPMAPSYPNPSRNYVIAGLLGLSLGLVTALGISYISRFFERRRERTTKQKSGSPLDPLH
jgi:uncharacterized protein involved in exopolysaccharide biosynthesis